MNKLSYLFFLVVVAIFSLFNFASCSASPEKVLGELRDSLRLTSDSIVYTSLKKNCAVYMQITQKVDDPESEEDCPKYVLYYYDLEKRTSRPLFETSAEWIAEVTSTRDSVALMVSSIYCLGADMSSNYLIPLYSGSEVVDLGIAGPGYPRASLSDFDAGGDQVYADESFSLEPNTLLNGKLVKSAWGVKTSVYTTEGKYVSTNDDVDLNYIPQGIEIDGYNWTEESRVLHVPMSLLGDTKEIEKRLVLDMCRTVDELKNHVYNKDRFKQLYSENNGEKVFNYYRLKVDRVKRRDSDNKLEFYGDKFVVVVKDREGLEISDYPCELIIRSTAGNMVALRDNPYSFLIGGWFGYDVSDLEVSFPDAEVLYVL